MTKFLWGVYPYICLSLFLAVPLIRMAYRPFGFSTRASSLFARRSLGVASLCMHWGLFVLFLGHLAGYIGGLYGSGGAVAFFYWSGLVGGLFTLLGSVIALWRRFSVPEVRAMSQWDDYVVHYFLVAILALGLYQVIVHRIFGVAYTASAWLGSVARLSPEPELMASASLISKVHVFLALTLFAVFPFTKLVHFWAYPFNYFVRPYQSMRTDRYVHTWKWELGLRTDQSWLVYGAAGIPIFFGLVAAFAIGGPVNPALSADGRLTGYPLYVSQCARCHGLQGNGDGPGASSPTFAQPPRDLTAGRYHFVSTANGVASDADLARTIRRGLVPAGMPAFDELSDAQVDALVSVLDGFAPNRQAPGATIEVPPRPANVSAARGKELFGQMCASCHGSAGRGDGPAASGLPVPPANLASGRLKAGAEPADLYWRMTAGINPAGMPPMAAGLTVEDRWALVEYLRTEVIPAEVARR